MKTVLITGASSGIGRELAFIFAKNNYNIVLVARRAKNLDEIKELVNADYNVDVHSISMDLSQLQSANQLLEKLISKGLKIDVLINNAGFGINASFEEMDLESEEQMIVLNILTLTKLTRLLGKSMTEQKKGHIINIASTAAFQAVPSFSSYAATKAYVLSFSEAIEYELSPFGVNVTTICPGATQSEFAAVSKAKAKMFAKAPSSNELAQFIFNAYKNNKGTTTHGLMNSIMVFGLRFTPRKIATKIAAMIMK